MGEQEDGMVFTDSVAFVFITFPPYVGLDAVRQREGLSR